MKPPKRNHDTLTGHDFRYDDPLPMPKAIREHCVGCKGYEVGRVKNCDDLECPHHGFRMGRREPGTKGPRSKAGRKKCLWCQNGSSDFVRDCEIFDCSLWPRREGKGKAILVENPTPCDDFKKERVTGKGTVGVNLDDSVKGQIEHDFPGEPEGDN